MSLDSFPIEVLQKIFSYCSCRFDYKAFSQVCHRWNDAVEYLLQQRMCLAVAAEVYAFPDGIGPDDEDYDEYEEEPDRKKTELISKEVLLSLTRKYTAIKIEVRNDEPDEIHKTLKELLNVCRKRYQVERLYLQGSPNKMLVQLFRGYYDWLQSLTLLDVKLYFPEPRARAGQMVTLPNLQRLRWNEADQYSGRGQRARRSNSGRIAFALNAPKLSFLSVRMDRENRSRDLLKSCHQDPEVCHLFLPTLELKAGSQLKHLDLTGVQNLNLNYIDGCERMFRNLEQLYFSCCPCDVFTRICDKCPNLKELSIKYVYEEGDIPLQISPTLSANLEKLKISSFDCIGYFTLYGPAVFSKLQSIYLTSVQFDTSPNVSLNAPQLTEINLKYTPFRQSILTNSPQVRTMSLQVLRWNEEEFHPQATVTDLSLYLLPRCVEVAWVIAKYLECVPHLTRLKLELPKKTGIWTELKATQLTKTYLTFVEALPNLEHLTICQATMRLIDCAKLAGLKSLVLSYCAIEVDSTIAVIPRVILTALEHVRIDFVVIDGGIESKSFPLQINDRQPPIRIAGVSSNGQNVFKSKVSEPPFDYSEFDYYNPIH